MGRPRAGRAVRRPRQPRPGARPRRARGERARRERTRRAGVGAERLRRPRAARARLAARAPDGEERVQDVGRHGAGVRVRLPDERLLGVRDRVLVVPAARERPRPQPARLRLLWPGRGELRMTALAAPSTSSISPAAKYVRAHSSCCRFEGRRGGGSACAGSGTPRSVGPTDAVRLRRISARTRAAFASASAPRARTYVHADRTRGAPAFFLGRDDFVTVSDTVTVS